MFIQKAIHSLKAEIILRDESILLSLTDNEKLPLASNKWMIRWL